MRKSYKELISEYFNAQLTYQEEEVNDLQQRIRYRKIYVNDSYELQNALVRYETTKQIFRDVSVFLRIEDNFIK